MFVQKKTDELRMTVDYHALNQQTKKDFYPLLWIHDLLDKSLHSQYLTAIDLASEHHKNRLAPDDCDKMMFIAQYGLLEYMVLPLALSNAPSTFQWLINAAL